MIYTSYFAVLRKLPDYVKPISIARRSPVWYAGKTYLKLAPPADILAKYKRDKNKADYIRAYYERVLNRLKPDDVVRELYAGVSNDAVALICYEKPDNFCHRRLVADWLNANGLECLEWKGESGL